jgi:hypothetical protein
MTTTTATKVDPFQKEHIPPLLAFSMAYKDIHTSPESNALIFCRNCIKSSLSFFSPICCTSALSFSPERTRKGGNETVLESLEKIQR